MIPKILKRHQARKVASRWKLAAPVNALKIECEYWGKHFGRKYRSKPHIRVGSGFCSVSFQEPYEEGAISYTVLGFVDPEGEIKWTADTKVATSGRGRAFSNDPRAIEKLVAQERDGAISLYRENVDNFAREVAYRYATGGSK